MTSHADRRALRAQLDRFLADSSNELEFLRHRASGTVHVVVPRTVGPVREFRFSEVPADVALDIALGVTHTLCGYVGRQNLHGAGCGDELVTEFDDVDLCQRCHRALGPHAPRAFEHRQPHQEGHFAMTTSSTGQPATPQRMKLTLTNREQMAAWIGTGAHAPDDPGSDVLLVDSLQGRVVIPLGCTVARTDTGFQKLPYGTDPALPSETVATYEHEGVRHEIDHLGIAHDDQYGEFAVYRDGQQIACFTTAAAGLRPQFRPELPSTAELIELAQSAVADAEQE